MNIIYVNQLNANLKFIYTIIKSKHTLQNSTKGSFVSPIDKS